MLHCNSILYRGKDWIGWKSQSYKFSLHEFLEEFRNDFRIFFYQQFFLFVKIKSGKTMKRVDWAVAYCNWQPIHIWYLMKHVLSPANWKIMESNRLFTFRIWYASSNWASILNFIQLIIMQMFRFWYLVMARVCFRWVTFYQLIEEKKSKN